MSEMLAFTMDSSLTDFLDAKEEDVHKSEAELKKVQYTVCQYMLHKYVTFLFKL